MKEIDSRTVVEFEVAGKYALFTEVLSRLGDEKMTSMFPTYSALKGVLDHVYWKPTIKWYIDEVRILNPIRMVSRGTNHMMKNDVTSPVNATYLYKPRYQVRAHFEFNEDRPDLREDYNINKHSAMAKRYLKRGGRLPVLLGTTECTADVIPCTFGEGDGFYDNEEILSGGMMLHSITYPDKEGTTDVIANFWRPIMEYGVIQFIRPEECQLQFNNGPTMTSQKTFVLGENVKDVNTEYDELLQSEVD